MSKLDWCRENAPDSIKDLPDEELLELMSSSYDMFVEGVHRYGYKHMESEPYINRTDRPLTEVEQFINEFMNFKTEDEREVIRSLFRSGYCWHFAHMLLATFERGQIVEMAPFGHICWQDTDGRCYDVEGQYCGEAFYAIPETFMEHVVPNSMLDYKHIPGKHYDISKDELISACKQYCAQNGKPYDSHMESYIVMDDNNKTISFEDMDYEVILRSINSNRIDFRCESECKFLKSLADAGYTEYTLTQSQDACAQYARRLQPGSCAPTSCAQTGYIYVPERDAYFNIIIENVGQDKYDVIIEKVLL